jgi:hypothetical protein
VATGEIEARVYCGRKVDGLRAVALEQHQPSKGTKLEVGFSSAEITTVCVGYPDFENVRSGVGSAEKADATP